MAGKTIDVDMRKPWPGYVITLTLIGVNGKLALTHGIGTYPQDRDRGVLYNTKSALRLEYRKDCGNMIIENVQDFNGREVQDAKTLLRGKLVKGIALLCASERHDAVITDISALEKLLGRELNIVNKKLGTNITVASGALTASES